MEKAFFQRKGVLAIGFVMLLMTACGNSPSGPVPTATPGVAPTSGPTEPPPPTATANPDCRKRELEDWLQASGQHSRGMMATLNDALITPREQIGDVLGRIVAIRNLLDSTKTPTCARDSKESVAALFDMVILRLTSFRDGENVDMQQLVNDANGLYGVVKLRDTDLRNLYKSLPREE